ncbi:MAG: aminotransferase class V-fold PLP-dependent enzyme [Acidimicrobiales bacterium]
MTTVVGCENSTSRRSGPTPQLPDAGSFQQRWGVARAAPVVDAMVDYLQLEATIGGYEAFGVTAERFERFYDSAAALLGCGRDEVAFCTSATDAWWRAFSSIPLAPGDRVLTGRAEYSANMFGLIQAKARGVDVVIIDNDSEGRLDLQQLASELERGAALVATTYISMASGGLNPVAEIGQLAKGAGAIYLLDATQAVGQINLDVTEIGCDFLVFTGRKWLRGLRSTAGLFVRGGRARIAQPVGIR